jgi:hypothetical protein
MQAVTAAGMSDKSQHDEVITILSADVLSRGTLAIDGQVRWCLVSHLSGALLAERSR